MGNLSGATQLKETDSSHHSSHQLPIAPPPEMSSSDSISDPCWNIDWCDLVQTATTAEFMSALTLSCPEEQVLL